MRSVSGYGIVATNSLCYVMARVVKTGLSWRIAKISRWHSDNHFKNMLLGGTGIILGMPTHWQPSGSQPQTFEFICDKTALQQHQQNLGENIQGVVSTDVFLSTVPRALARLVPDSFISICPLGDHYKIGVIIDQKLTVVFNCAPATTERLSGHLNRITRYLEQRIGIAIIPRTIYYIGNDVPVLPGAELIPVQLPPSVDRAFIPAVGVALSAALDNEDSTATIAPAHPAARYISHRRNVFMAAVGLIIVALLGIIGSFTARSVQEYRLINATRDLHAQKNRTTDLTALNQQNDSLAALIMLKRSQFATSTNWAALLEALGAKRPAGLFYERLGCEQLPDNAGQLQLAISGNSPDELSVTTLLSELQNLTFISQGTIAKLERHANNQATVNYQILCIFQLSKK